MGETVEYGREIQGHDVTFEIISREGNRQYKGIEFERKKDRIYFVRLRNLHGDIMDWPISYEDQFKLMELIMNNIILDRVFEREYNEFIKLLSSIKKRRLEVY